MKVTVVTLGRSHLIHLARLLDKKEDVEVTFYTMMPASRCKQFGYNGKVKSLLFPIGALEVLIRVMPLVGPYTKDTWHLKLNLLFDRMVAMRLRKCDVMIGLNGNACKATKKAKKMNAVTICDQGSSHILKQSALRRTYSDAPISEVGTKNMLEHYVAADYLMTPAEYVRQSDLENGIAADKILYNPYGVDLNLFKPATDIEEKEFDVIMVGSWWKHKGCEMLAEACIDRLNVKLLHVGSIIDCALPESPFFTHVDFVSEKDLPKFYSKAKVFAIPSLDEGYGLVLLQAAACGLPIVGSSRTGTPDTGLLLGTAPECITIKEPLSVDTIADAIKKGLDIANSMPEGIRNTYGDTIQNISWEAYGNRWYDILKSLIKR